VAFNSRNSEHETWTLQVIDIHEGSWGQAIDLPGNTQEVFHGSDEYLVLLNNGMSLTGLDKWTNDEIVLFNWIDSGIWPAGLANVLLLPGYRIMFTAEVWDHNADGSSMYHTELVFLNRLQRDELPEITKLTIASFMPHLLDPAVVEFNRTNFTYNVEIIELDINTLTESIDDLFSDIIAGNGPDMIHTCRLPVFYQWARQGLFEDLNELIDTDPILNRSSFTESVLKGFESDGKLYRMAPGFNVRSLIGFPGIVGSTTGWDIEEFITVIDENPQATLPLGPDYNGFGILYLLLSNNIESFIDRETGEVFFDSDFFIELLEFAYKVELNINQNSISISENIPHRRISSGEQIMELVTFSRFEEFSVFQDLFNGSFVFKGLPSENGSGNYLDSDYGIAVNAESENKDGVREFFRLFLSEGWQRQTVSNTGFLTHYIPTNRAVLEESITGAMVGFKNPFVMYGDLSTSSRPLTPEDAGKIRELIDSISSVDPPDDFLMDLLTEVLIDFFDGSITAQEAAEILQERAT